MIQLHESITALSSNLLRILTNMIAYSIKMLDAQESMSPWDSDMTRWSLKMRLITMTITLIWYDIWFCWSHIINQKYQMVRILIQYQIRWEKNPESGVKHDCIAGAQNVSETALDCLRYSCFSQNLHQNFNSSLQCLKSIQGPNFDSKFNFV